MISVITVFILTLGTSEEAFKILVLYPTPSFSHQRSIMALTERLVKEGHELFVVSPNVVPELREHRNYSYVDLSFAYEYTKNPNKEGAVNLQVKMSKWEIADKVVPTANIIKNAFQKEEFLQFIKHAETEKIKFDVVITENWVMSFTCGLARLLPGPPPVISMTTAALDDFAEEPLGSLTHLSFVPSMYGHYSDRMNLWQRLENWVSHLYLMRKFRNGLESVARSYFRENFGPEKEGLVDGCWNCASLSIITSNPVYFYPRLLGPNVIEVGPLYLRSPEKLPKNLQDWLDGAEEGVIFFSLGSNMKSKSLPEEVISNLLLFFKELPVGYRVLWKWELDGKIPGQPDNILTQTWVPQESVLAHPKVKMFITQGGLQSFQEAVHYGVPTVAIPWFGDQECIASKMVDAGVGARLLASDLYSYEKIKAVIETVLYDESFSKNMKRLSAISQDFTSQALDKTIFWIKHVTRHGGATHLRPTTTDTTLSEYFCLDIIAAILVIVSIVSIVVFCLVKFSISVIVRLSSVEKIKES